MFTENQVRDRIREVLEEFWGTAWGEADWTAYQNIVNIVLGLL